MRPTARKLLATLVQEAFSYELSLNRPVDPHSGSNATIEQNPKAVKDLIEVPEGRRLLDEAYSKMSVYAKYEFLTEVGYHGLSNSASIGAGILTAMEELKLDPIGPGVNFETLLNTNEEVARLWAGGVIKTGQYDKEYENAILELNKQYYSYLDLTGDFNRRTFELYLGWGKLYSADPFKTLLADWPSLNREERWSRLDVLKTGLEDRLNCVKDATPIWRANVPVDQLEDLFTSRHGTVYDELGEYQYSSPFIEFFKESSQELVDLLKEQGYDRDVTETFEGFAKRLKELSEEIYTRDYLEEAKRFQEGGRALLRAYLLKRFGGLQVSQEGLDELYCAMNDLPPAVRHTSLPMKQQTVEGITNELDQLFAATVNIGLDDNEQKFVEEIYHSETFGKDFLSGKWIALREHNVGFYNAIAQAFKFHQSENGSWLWLLQQYVDNKGPDLEQIHAVLDWIDGAMTSGITTQKAVEQFDSGHPELGAPCFEICEKACERATNFPGYEYVLDVNVKKIKSADEKSMFKFELLSNEQAENADLLFTRFIGKTRTLPKIEQWLEAERVATAKMGSYDLMNDKAGAGSVRPALVKYARFVDGLRECINLNKYVFGSMACSVRNILRTKINLIDLIFKARAGEFTMEGLDEELGVEQLLMEGAKYSEEGIVDFLKKIFKIKKKRPNSDELYLEELEKECKSWKNPAAKALAAGGIREVPEELLAKLKAIAADDFSPSMWRTAQLKRFFQFACECNKIEDLGSVLYEELSQANTTDEVLAIVDKMRNNIKAFLELCKRHGIDKKKRPEFTPVPDIELFRDVTSNMNASMAMLERGWSSREGGSWLIFETKYYGWFSSALEDGDTNPVIDEIDEDKLREIQIEIDNLVDELRDHFNWAHHPVHDIEQYITKARLAVLKYGEQIEEGKIKNVAMEEIDDQEVVRLLSEGVQVSQEGFLDIVRRLFGSKRERPEQVLERLERAASGWKNPVAKALVEGTAETLPQKLAESLVELSVQEFAPCQWLSKELKPFTDCYTEGARTLIDRGESFFEELKKARDRKELEAVFSEARTNINGHIELAKKYKMTLERAPSYVKVPAEELYLDLTKRLAESVRFAEQCGGKQGYNIVYTTQYYGWFFSALENQDSVAFEDFSDEEIKAIVDEFKHLGDELDTLYEWSNTPDHDSSRFIKQGRLMLLQVAEQIEKGKGDNLVMEGLVSNILDFVRGRKPAPAPAGQVETKPDLRPDRLGFGYDEAYDFAEEFIAKTKGKGGDLDIQAITGDRFTIPTNLLKFPHGNKQMILHWFEANCPENKGKVEMFYKAFEERVGADTCVLPLWLGSKETQMLRTWSAFGKACRKVPRRDHTSQDMLAYKKLWENSGIAELVKRVMKLEDLSEASYSDFLSDLFTGYREIDKGQYEKAALGANCTYSQIGTFAVYRFWATPELIGEENYYCGRLLGKTEDKYCQVEYEWAATLQDLMILAWHIGNLSGKKA